MLIRMISSIKKWDKNAYPILRDDPSFPGDSITDLKTTRNKLSVWKSSNDEETKDAIVAMAVGRNTIDKLWFVYLDEEELAALGISALADEKGDAPGVVDDSLLRRHMNLQHIDYIRLGKLAEYIYKQLETKNYALKTISQLKELLTEYKESGIIDLAPVKDGIKNKMNWNVIIND